MAKLTNFNGKVLAYHPSPEPLLARPPFLARHPWVGFTIFIIFGAVYAWLTEQVLVQGPITRFDAPFVQAMHAWARQQSAALIFLMRFLSAYGRDGEALIALVLTIGWARRRARRELWMLFFGMLAGEIWFQALGSLVNRHRPVFPDPFETLSGAGFPSGHAVTTVLLGWLILYLLLPHIHSVVRRIFLILAVVLVSAGILYSRLFLGLHYPTDIAGGVALGLAWGGLVYPLIDLHFYRPQKAADFRPAAIPVTGTENMPANQTNLKK